MKANTRADQLHIFIIHQQESVVLTCPLQGMNYISALSNSKPKDAIIPIHMDCFLIISVSSFNNIYKRVVPNSNQIGELAQPLLSET